jgi:hypothetical protein
MALTESWQVRSRSRECAATSIRFTDGETIITALYPDPDSSGYLRRDFSTNGWQNLPPESGKPFSFWKTTYSAPPENENQSIEQKLSPEEILRRLVDEDEDHTENTRYILAVMLERRKLLRETDHQRTPSGILRVYEHRKTGEVFLIRDPDIPLAQVEAVQLEVSVLLENNGRLPTPHQPPADSGTTPPQEPSSEPPSQTPDSPPDTATNNPQPSP